MPRGVRTVVVYGGTFDPVHEGHLRPAVAVMRKFGKAGLLVYVPAGRSPFKKGGPVASDEDRVAMLKLAIGKAAVVWTDEIDRARDGAASYMITTVRRLRKLVGKGVVLRLLIGSDQAASFHRWKDARALVRLAEPLVMMREPIATAEALRAAIEGAGYWRAGEIEAWMGRVATTKVVEGEATRVREGAARGAKGAFEHVPEVVRKYVEERGIYGSAGKSEI